jgi:signal transduction histidine kinase
MTDKRPALFTRWMISPLEGFVLLAVVVMVIGGLSASILDAIQLEQAINLQLTQNFIISQGVVNLQREVLITHEEVLRLLGRVDRPPKPVTRFEFAKVQVNNLVSEVNSPSAGHPFPDEDVALAHTIETQAAEIEKLIDDLNRAETFEAQMPILSMLDTRLEALESVVKELIDRESGAQRTALVQTRDSLAASQRTSFLTAGALLLMAAAMAGAVGRGLNARLKQAVEAERLKGQLLTSVSHELRTPINAVQGYSQLLMEDTFGPLSGEQKMTMRRILLNTTQLQGMVNNLLDRAQIEQGKLMLRNAPFSPADFIESAHAALNILALSKGLELTSEIASDVPEMLIGDTLRLQQILFNLTSNALKFTEQGHVHIKIFMPDANHWALEVSDTGIGIPIEAQSHIFATFWQVDSSATREHRGSGLGLAIVKQLADLMGARVTLTSQLGSGSKFTVIFPMETL